MSTFLEIDCGGETVTLEKTDDGNIIFHGWDEETEMAAIELGFNITPCLVVWEAINDDELDIALRVQSAIGNTATIEALLFCGARINSRSIGGLTALHRASWQGHTDIVKFLLDAGADVNARDDKGVTPLHKASDHCNRDIAKLLLSAGASPVGQDYLGETPLHIARRWCNEDLCKIFKAWIAEHGE